MFSKIMSSFIIKIAVGLKKDYEIKSEKIELKLHKGVYLPYESYNNCDMFPQTWIEMIDKIIPKLQSIKPKEANEEEQNNLIPYNSLLKLEKSLIKQRPNSKY